jgi:hypothetical protein
LSRQTTRAALVLAALVSAVTALAASPASATYRAPSLPCGADGGTLDGTLCVLPFGVTTAPNNYSVSILPSNPNTGDTFALVSGSLPPGLTMPAQSGPGTVIAGNPTQTGTFNFTIKVIARGGLSGKAAFQITVTVAGPPDQLLCDPADNNGYVISGACVLPDAIAGQPYQGHLPTSHKAGGTLAVISGALPPGLSLPASFGSSGNVISGSATATGSYNFTVQGTGDHGQPLYQAYQITVDPNQPLTVVLPASGSTLFPGTVGQAFAINFFLSGGAAPYAWSLASGHLPPGLGLQTFASTPRDADNELAGTPTTAGTYTWTMRVTDFYGHTATQQFSLTIQS